MLVMPYLIFADPLLYGWENSLYVKYIKKRFATIFMHTSDQYVSAVGLLHLAEDDIVCPEYFMKYEDGSVKSYQIEVNKIPLSELPLSEDEIKEIKENGYLIISKFERKESVNA